MPPKRLSLIRTNSQSLPEASARNETSLEDSRPSAILKAQVSSRHVMIEDIDIEEPKCWKFLYNSEERTVCGRTASSWIKILTYAFLYLMFLATYTMLLLYVSLTIIRIYEPYLVEPGTRHSPNIN
ncbi:hypothetical protein EVAR_59206_1 [Eumeta japonica]|uniref:Uncharacterized protein n=1 Tax=Eumeta variegata TaxID=151549 RepID=A0A4C1ZLI8_EUMVA|nr:hypothetical protein EVAR_59206_1 [Eumeta japonica]